MKKLFLLIGIALTSIAMSAQENTIKGKLFDQNANNEPITFGNVTIKETNQSVTTDFRGQYFFENLEPGTYTLQFSFLGYQTVSKKITIAKEQELEVDASIHQSIAANFNDIASITSSIE